MNRSRITLIVVALVVINVLALSFTYVNKGSYKNSLYYRFTRQRFAWIISDPHPKYAIRAGWANVTITPTAASAADSIQARAIVLDNGTTRAAMITVDLLMMPPTVSQALEQKLPRLGLAWKNVYLGATYSQHDPGGWSKEYMGKQQAAPYDEQRVNQLTEAILKAVTLAQNDMATVQLGYTQNEALHLLQLRKPTGESALIFSGDVHSVSTDKNTDATSNSDFFRLLTQELEKQTHAFTLGIAGSIQETNRPNHTSPAAQQVNQVAAQLATLLARQSLHTDSTLIAQSTPLIQNDPQIRISKNWRLKPWLAKALYGDYPAELKALRIGQTVFVGCPAGVSSELTSELLSLPIARQRKLVVTSYNGGNLGQLVPDSYYYAENSPYPLSQTNRFGPYTAEFFKDMTQSLVSSLK